MNGISTTWIVDTGAARAVVNQEEATKLGLVESGRTARLTGIGNRTAQEAQPVTVGWRERKCSSSPYIVKDLKISGLLGIQEAGKLGMVLRPKARTVDVNFVDERTFDTAELPEQLPPPEKRESDNSDKEKEQVMRRNISEELSPMQTENLWKTLMKHQKVWTNPRFGCVKTKAQFIATDRPVKDKLRPMSAEMREEMEKQIKELLELKVIRPSKSPWASSPVFVRKADGSWRMALDYRRVNKRIKTDGYPIPLLWEQLQMAAGYLYYARLDGKSGFFNVPLTEESKELTAFNSHRGLYEFNVLPFGMKNSPGEFQRVMDEILSDLYGKGVLCYIDDIVIYANQYEQWVELIDTVFQKLWDGGVYIEPKKCQFGVKQIPLLGHIITSEGVMPNPKKIEAIKAAVAPRTRKEVMSFLGLVGFIRRFIPRYSDRTIALTGLLKKRAVFNWTKECQEEFEQLKQIVADHVLLSVPSGRGPFVIICDASDKAIGSVLAQWRDSALHILEFSSKKFSPAERNWSTREKEAFAIRWSVQRFEPYVKGAKIFVLTDHASLQWMDTASSGKVQRWALYLQQYDITVRAISGRDNGMADWLSRSVHLPDPEADAEIDATCTPVNVIGLTQEEEDVKTYARSPYIPPLNQWIEASRDIPEEDRKYLSKGTDGLWYSEPGRKLYVPKPLRESLLYWFHAAKYGGHFGINKTHRRLCKWFYWPKQKEDVSAYITACLPCRRVQPPGRRYLRQVLERSEPFQLVSLDHVGPREWNAKKTHYLVIIDHFSRFVVAREVEKVTAATTVKVFRDFWISTFGAPEAVLVDKGTAFVSKAFQSFVCDELAATLVYSGTGYPQGNAINEAVHKGIEASIVSRIQYDTFSDFQEILSDAVIAYNSTPHSSTGHAPYFMLFGKEMILPGLQRFKDYTPEATRRARIRDIRMQAMHRSIIGADEGLRLYKPAKFEPGTKVIYFLPSSERTGKQTEGDVELVKYTPQWSTPATVIRTNIGNVDLRTAAGKEVTIPSRLVRRIGQNIPPSLQPLVSTSIEREQCRFRVRPEWEEMGSKKRKI